MKIRVDGGKVAPSKKRPRSSTAPGSTSHEPSPPPSVTSNTSTATSQASKPLSQDDAILQRNPQQPATAPPLGPSSSARKPHQPATAPPLGLSATTSSTSSSSSSASSLRHQQAPKQQNPTYATALMKNSSNHHSSKLSRSSSSGQQSLSSYKDSSQNSGRDIASVPEENASRSSSTIANTSAATVAKRRKVGSPLLEDAGEKQNRFLSTDRLNMARKLVRGLIPYYGIVGPPGENIPVNKALTELKDRFKDDWDGIFNVAAVLIDKQFNTGGQGPSANLTDVDAVCRFFLKEPVEKIAKHAKRTFYYATLDTLNGSLKDKNNFTFRENDPEPLHHPENKIALEAKARLSAVQPSLSKQMDKLLSTLQESAQRIAETVESSLGENLTYAQASCISKCIGVLQRVLSRSSFNQPSTESMLPTQLFQQHTPQQQKQAQNQLQHQHQLLAHNNSIMAAFAASQSPTSVPASSVSTTVPNLANSASSQSSQSSHPSGLHSQQQQQQQQQRQPQSMFFPGANLVQMQQNELRSAASDPSSQINLNSLYLGNPDPHTAMQQQQIIQQQYLQLQQLQQQQQQQQQDNLNNNNQNSARQQPAMQPRSDLTNAAMMDAAMRLAMAGQPYFSEATQQTMLQQHFLQQQILLQHQVQQQQQQQQQQQLGGSSNSSSSSSSSSRSSSSNNNGSHFEEPQRAQQQRFPSQLGLQGPFPGLDLATTQQHLGQPGSQTQANQFQQFFFDPQNHKRS